MFFQAAHTPGGLSGQIIALAKKHRFEVIISQQILDETIRNLRLSSSPIACDRHNRNISKIHPVKLEPIPNIVSNYIGLISEDDAPILGLATTSKASYLVTQNVNHFINNPYIELLDLPYEIVRPSKLIEKLGKD